LCGGVLTDARLVEQPWCELAGERFDLAGELALLEDQLQDAPRDRAEREQAAAQLGIASTVGRVAARRCSNRALLSGRSSLRSGSGS